MKPNLRRALLLGWLFLPVPFLAHFFPDETTEIRFTNIAAEAGIQPEIRCGGPEKKWIPEANGTGAAWLDYDNDGRLDLLIVNGSTLEQLRHIVSGKALPPQKEGVFLYRNLGNGRFRDVTVEALLADAYWGTGANAVDYDNDGFTDILITNIGIDLLYRNNRNGTFSEVGKAAGLSQKVAWHTGSAFGDPDNDGDLDLYVAGYVDLQSLSWSNAAPVCQYKGIGVFCGPRNLRGESDLFYRNNGNGTFTEATQPAGLCDTSRYYGFAVLFEDLNGDGRTDLFVANDSCPNYLYLNLGNGAFKEAGLTSGLALNGDGHTQANMGVAAGDYDNDGDLDLLTTTFSEDYFPLFEQVKPGLYEDAAFRTGLGVSTVSYLGWACGFADFDNDGDRDLWTANGHVYPNAGDLATTNYLQPVAVFENHNARFLPVPSPVGPVATQSYRGGCLGDFNDDGRLDIAVLPVDGKPLLLENRSRTRYPWIGFRLRGRQRNRDALGARVEIQSCGKKQFETLRNGGSYLSRNDPRIHFGLGNCSQVDAATILWPSGSVQRMKDLAINRYITIEESR
jgi:enediyne biosynthesis protein E4